MEKSFVISSIFNLALNAFAETERNTDIASFKNALAAVKAENDRFIRKFTDKTQKSAVLATCKKLGIQESSCFVEEFASYKKTIVTQLLAAQDALVKATEKFGPEAAAPLQRDLQRFVIYFTVVLDRNPFPAFHRDIVCDPRFHGEAHVLNLNMTGNRTSRGDFDSAVYYLSHERLNSLVKVLREQRNLVDAIVFAPGKSTAVQLSELENQGVIKRENLALNVQELTQNSTSYINTARSDLSTAKKTLEQFASYDKQFSVDRDNVKVRYNAEFLRQLHNSFVRSIAIQGVEKVIKTVRMDVNENSEITQANAENSAFQKSNASISVNGEVSLTGSRIGGSISGGKESGQNHVRNTMRNQGQRQSGAVHTESVIESIDTAAGATTYLIEVPYTL